MKSLGVLILGILLLSTLAVMPNTQATEKEYKELNPVHVINGTIGNVACWGDKVVWSEGWDNINVWNTGGGTSTFQVNLYESNLAMSDQAIVWQNSKDYEQPDVYYSTSDGGPAQSMPTNTDRADHLVRLDGNKIVYEYMGEYSSELRVATVGGSAATSIAVWPDYNNYDISGDNVAAIGDYSAMQVYDTSGTLLKDWGQGYYATENLRISGDYLAYYDLMDFGNGAHVYLKNWKTNETERIIYHMEGQPGGLDIEGNFVVFWAAKNPELGSGGSAVFIYDIQAKMTYQISPEYSRIYDVAIGGGRVAWVTGLEILYQNPDLNYWNLYTAELPEPGTPPVEDPVDYPDDPCAEFRTEDRSATIALDEGIKFTADDGEHRIYARGITSTGATLDVYSDFTTITLDVGETKTVEGLEITLDSVDVANQTVQLSIEDVVSETEGDGSSAIPSIGFLPVIIASISLALIIRASKRKD